MTDFDAWSLITDTDKNGLPLEWINLRDSYIVPLGVKSLPYIFSYYEQHNPFFDSWTNFMLSVSHFTDEELNLPCNRQMRRQLEQKVKKLIGKRQKDKTKNIHTFLRENSNIII